jgi:hypothetical protein
MHRARPSPACRRTSPARAPWRRCGVLPFQEPMPPARATRRRRRRFRTTGRSSVAARRHLGADPPRRVGQVIGITAADAPIHRCVRQGEVVGAPVVEVLADPEVTNVEVPSSVLVVAAANGPPRRRVGREAPSRPVRQIVHQNDGTASIATTARRTATSESFRRPRPGRHPCEPVSEGIANAPVPRAPASSFS